MQRDSIKLKKHEWKFEIINFFSSMTYYRFFLFSCKSWLFVNISVYLFIIFIYLPDFDNDIIFFFWILL